MVSKVRITKPLQKYFNNLESIELDADSYYNLYSNMVNLFKDFRQVSLELGTNKYADLWFVVDGHLLPTDQIFFPVKKGAEISLIPVIGGSGDALPTIFIGLAIIALAVVAMQPTIAFGLAASISGSGGIGAVIGTAGVITSVAQGFLSVGISLVLSGVVSAFASKQDTPQRTTQDSNIRAQNDAFGSLQNTTHTQTPIALIFGQMRVPGQLVSGRIRTIQHDVSTSVSVANYV